MKYFNYKLKLSNDDYNIDVAVKVYNNYIFCSDTVNNIHVYDKSDFSLYTTLSYASYDIVSFCVDNNLLYAGSLDDNIYVYDISNLNLEPTIIDVCGGNVNYIDIDNNYIYAGCHNNAVYVINKSDYSLYTTITDLPNDCKTLAVDDTRLYVLPGGNDIQIYDKSTFTQITGSPFMIGSYQYFMSIDDNYVYISRYVSDRIDIYNKSDMSHIKELRDMTNNCGQSISKDGFLYVSSGDDNLYIYDINDDFRLVYVLEEYFSQDNYSFDIDNDYIYSHNNNDVIHIHSVDDIYFLVKDSSDNIKTVENGKWVNTDLSEPLSKTDFIENEIGYMSKLSYYNCMGLSSIVPNMTSNTEPEGIVTASIEYGSDYGYYAFDGKTRAESDYWYTGGGNNTGWLAYEFNSPRQIALYIVQCAFVDYAPSDFTFEAWDGSSWVVLDTQTNVDWSYNDEIKSFSITNTTSYIKYRINVTRAYNDGPIGISELFLSTEENVLSDEFEIISWTNYTEKEPIIQLGIPSVKPIDLLEQPVTIKSWINEISDLKITQNVDNKEIIKYMVSIDNTTWYGFDGSSWIENYEMTETELTSITGTQFKNWMGDSIYKYDFYYKIIIKSLDPNNNMTIRSITTTFEPNQKPLLVDPLVTPDEIHNNHVEVSGTLVDLEGDDVEYRVSIQKAGETGFTVVNDWTTKSTGDSFIRAYNFPYFNIGTNDIKVEFRDSRGVDGTEFIGNVTLTNTNPAITYSYNDFKVWGTVGDDDSDDIRWRVSINGSPAMDYTPFLSTPRGFVYEWDSDDVTLGASNTILVEAEDTFGGTASESFNITGKYKGIMFMDSEGNFYTSDQGDVLQLLNLPQIIAGQNSDPQVVTLLNQSGSSLENINIIADNHELPANANVYIDLEESTFSPNSLIELPSILDHGETVDFYIAIYVTAGGGKLNSRFRVRAEGSIVST